PEIELNLSEETHITALFEFSDNTVLPEFFTIDDTLYTALSPYMGMGDININAGVSVYVQPGVEILMPESCCINVYGQLIINGLENAPVTIKANSEVGTKKWGALCFYNSTDSCFINYLSISDASIGRIDTLQIGAISSFNSKLYISSTTIKNSHQPFYSELGEIQITHSSFRSDKTCDLINIKYADFALVENCDLQGSEAPDTDAVDYDQISEGIIRNNLIYGFFGFNSDGIDIGEQAQDTMIENNRIFNCSDKGISVGQASSAIIKRNLIFNCNLGVGIKDSLAYADIDQNTFYNNNYAVACFEKNYNSGGGSAVVKNSILANSKIHSYLRDEKSQLDISYSLSNTDIISGAGNLFLDPLFVDTLIMNFELQTNSPCINAGDPSSPSDPDGSNADMGAYYVFNPPAEAIAIVINEINYHSDSLFDSGDWIEFYNNSDTDVDLSGWILMDSKDENRYNFSNGVILKENEYLVICNDKMKFCNINPEVINFTGNIPFLFINSGEVLRLFDAEMNLIDLVDYDDCYPWPEEPDGKGSTLQLLDPDSDNNIPYNWIASEALGGTPGKHYLTNIMESAYNELRIYPNPATHYFYIQSDKIVKEPMTIEIYTICGRIMEQMSYSGLESEIKIDCSSLEKGLYLIRIIQNKVIFNGKIIIQ
ncbi:MAG: lamin tail domain-containing protein, partial [Bacteroidales bacterium]|nr:lamin tail domain-containing protein [Bacteroidales bacterium]